MGDKSVSFNRLQNQNRMLKRKRKLNTLDENSKILKNSGQAYQGRDRNFHFPKEYSQDENCGVRCNQVGCRLSEERKIEIFNQFWRTGNYNEQNDILARYSRRIQSDNQIAMEYQYFAPNANGTQLTVCKRTFLSIFGVSKKRIRLLHAKISSGNISLTDQRGRHENRPNKLGDDVRESIINHINSYEKFCGHYSRQSGDPERAYLSKDLNQSIMFRDFAAAYGEEALNWEWRYRSLFRELKLRIGIPRSDTCTTCDRYHSKIEQLDEVNENDAVLLQEIWTNYMEHQLNSENGYTDLSCDLKKSKLNHNYVTICVDMQSVLPCPRLSNSDFYYQRKFSCFNVGIFEGANESTTMCLWNQREASRGSSEIASCIYKYCIERFAPLENEESRTLIVYSDRCVGQNNNFMILILYRMLIEQKLFTEVNQKFMVTGHSFLPCDRQFALIEKKQKTASIYKPDDWIEIIKSSCHSNPFNVQRMFQDEFKDFKSYSQNFIRPATLKVTECLWFKLSSTFPNQILSKDLLWDATWTTHNVRVKRGIINLQLNQLYQMPLIVPQGLIEDLRNMQDFIPQDSKPFWQFIYENQ